MTQFQRASKELDIRLITAHSPQAKGRVERLFKTLQDRLIKEMRLRNISDTKTANTFLEKEFLSHFNEKFGVDPEKKGDVYRELCEKEKTSLESIFSLHSQRVVSNDFTIRFSCVYYQLEEEQPTTVLRKDTVILEERLDASLHILLRGKELNFHILPERPKRKNLKKITALTPKREYTKPAKDHPWRRNIFSKNKHAHTY